MMKVKGNHESPKRNSGTVVVLTLLVVILVMGHSMVEASVCVIVK